jgi:molybdopterin-guanine dinucleotide biosynthesis protein A
VTDLGIGILVGGQGSRLGGVAKGLLPLPNGKRVLDQLLDECRRAAPNADLYLLGSRAEYTDVGLPLLPDAPAGVGPIGGLRRLLGTAHAEVLLLGCDQPFLSAALLTRLLAAPIVTAAALTRGAPPRWEPMVSRFVTARALTEVETHLAAGNLGLYTLLERVNATSVHVSDVEARQLDDWDSPDDVARALSPRNE